MTPEQAERIWDAEELIRENILEGKGQDRARLREMFSRPTISMIQAAPVDQATRDLVYAVYINAINTIGSETNAMGKAVSDFFLLALAADGVDPLEFVKRGLERMQEYRRELPDDPDWVS